MPHPFPLPKSTFIIGWEWTGDRIAYPDPDIKGDSFPMTWAEDGEIYTSPGDPLWGDSHDGLDVEKFSGGPTGMICVNGLLYLAVQNMRRAQQAPFSLESQHGSDAQISYSFKKGVFWIPAFANIATPMFPGHKFGGPVFVNCGQNNANAPDGYIYAVSSDQWDNCSNLRLGHVPADSIMRREAWEWVCAFDPARQPAWSHDLEESIPVLGLHRWLGAPEMVYPAGIQRYLLITWRLRKDFSPDDGTDLIIMESLKP